MIILPFRFVLMDEKNLVRPSVTCLSIDLAEIYFSCRFIFFVDSVDGALQDILLTG